MIDENAGNRVTAAHGNDLHEDIGNRVDGNTGNTGNTGPGASHNDVDDNIGNR